MIEWTYSHAVQRPQRLPGHTTPALQAKYARSRNADPNPSGVCLCGCGGATTRFKGKARRFLFSHHLRGMKRGEGRYVNSNGYVYRRAPNHPDATAHKGYVLEHRLVAEQTLGRALRADEAVHHINGERTDNRPENLVVLTTRAHGQLHGRGHTYRA